ncbi:DNA replication endonuclease-helicase Dna2 [Coemansia sp. RSA 1286]|nr:DNA replication endonuclease-helicase Dna2 [Coemansia sp. RSA 1286]
MKNEQTLDSEPENVDKQVQPDDVTQKRKREATTPHRHHSADSPLSARTNNRADNASDDVILWQAMSPSGTLKRVLRQPMYLGQRGMLVDNSSLTQGIVQQIIESRNTDPMIATTDKTEDDVIRALRRPPRLSLHHAGSSDLSNELDMMLTNNESATGIALDTTPVAKRVVRAIPRPLSISKSEKGFDKRLLLSGLLHMCPEQNKTCEAATNSERVPLIKQEDSEFISQTRLSGTDQSAATADPDRCSSKSNAVCSDIPIKTEHPAHPTTITQSTNSTNSTNSKETQPGQQLNDADADLDLDLDMDLQLNDLDMDSLLEGLDGVDDMDPTENIDDLLLDVDNGGAAQAPALTGSSPFRMLKAYERCLTLLVTDGAYTSDQLEVHPSTSGAWRQRVLRVYSQTAHRERCIYLRDEWVSTPVSIGDHINIVGDFSDFDGQDSPIVFDSQTVDRLFILNPDILVSCTHLSDSFSCTRRAVLRDRIREIDDGSPPNSIMLVGVMLHELFQSCALQNKWDDETISSKIHAIITENIDKLWECQIDETAMNSQIIELVPIFQSWAASYLHRSASNGAKYTNPNALVGRNSVTNPESAKVALSKILDVEENIWSPKFGLKGKVDLTVLAQYIADGAKVQPFELKTGRATQNTSHRAQVILYTLLLSDRYDVSIDAGILYYPRSGEMIQVQRSATELRALIGARNEMTQYLKHEGHIQRSLPGMCANEHKCKTCGHQSSCFVLHKALENGSQKSAGVSNVLWEGSVDHLTEAHMEFIRNWMGLIDREESEVLRFRAELWNLSSQYREQKTGRCLSDMRLVIESVEDTHVSGSYNRYRIAFVPKESDSSRSLLDTQVSVGDPITVSTQCGQYALSVGYVFALEYNRIVLALDRPVRGIPKRLPQFNAQTNQDFESIVEIRQRGGSLAGEETLINPDVPASAANDVFRIDQDEMNSGISRVRANLMRMFVARGGNEKCRRLIVDLQAPTFRPLHKDIEEKVIDLQQEKRLNTGQVAVLRKVLAANDYALVMGMPGTGKTTTIAELVGLLVSQGKSVLIASYTHVAVDNILLKLEDLGIPIVRLGNKNRVHPRIVKHLPSETELLTVKQIDRYFSTAPVVATTCLGVNHPVFTRRTFDYCIIDEASQITLPVCLGPLLESSKFVLVGDHYQLPPLVCNFEARESGLGTSLFKRLCEAHPSSVVRLEYQYRMNSDIQRLANNLIYDGHLRCGTLLVANKRISYKVDPAAAIQSWPFDTERLAGDLEMNWAAAALDPSRGAVFLDTDNIPGTESKAEGTEIAQNIVEVRIVKVLAKILQACGVEGRNVGILSPYRTQLKQLEIEFGVRTEIGRDSVTHNENGSDAEPSSGSVPKTYSGIELHTIDRYQGRDADVIIISFVRSNGSQAIGDLLRDWRRINVAITRARLKLIMVGSSSTLKRSPLIGGMIKMLAPKGCVIQIPKKAQIPAIVCTSKSKESNADKAPKPGASSSKIKTAGSALLKRLPIAANIISE